MKQLLSLILAIVIALSLTACKIEDLPFLNKDTQVSSEDEELKYKIDKVILSKGYQSLEPKVEVIKKNNNVSLIITAGLVESSGVQVEKIVKIGNVINIHVINEAKEDDLQLVVPQIILDLKNSRSINMDEVKFNIVNENFKPLNAKIALNDVINKVVNDFKLTANSSPNISLLKEDDMLVWNISYNSIFDNYNLETPLVNLTVRVDANTGDILESRKGLISSYIDDGSIVDYVDEEYILYKKNLVENDLKLESLWYFDIANNEISQVYQTYHNILSAEFSPKARAIAILESNGNTRDLYIVTKDEKKAFKALFLDNLSPSIVRWYDDDRLYLVQNDDDKSKIYSYDISTSKNELEATIYRKLTGMRIYEDHIILVEPIEESSNNNIYYTQDWSSLTLIDTGFMPRYISKDKLAYLKNSEENDRNHLMIYDMKNHKEYDQVDVNATYLSSIPGDELLVVEKNQAVNDYTVYIYNLNDGDLNFISKLNSQNIYANKKKNLLYVGLVVPFESKESEILFSVDISKLSNILP